MDRQQEEGVALEQVLKDDSEGTARDRMVSRLEQEARRLKVKMDRGVSPADYALISKQYESLQRGAVLVAELWRARQGTC